MTQMDPGAAGAAGAAGSAIEDAETFGAKDAPSRADNGAIAWMNTQEAAAHLGITVRTLYRAIDEGKLTAYRMGRVIRIQKPDLDAYLEASRIQPGELVHLYPETVDSRQS